MRTLAAQAIANGRRFTATPTWLIRVVRRDGAEYRLCAHDQLLSERNFPLYTPEPGVTVFAERRAAGLQPRSTELRGVVAEPGAPLLAGITYDDLRAGRLRGALIDKRMGDWMFPWVSEPQVQNTYRVTELEFDESTWSMELTGLTDELNVKRGDVYSPLCQNTLGLADGVRSFCTENISVHPKLVNATVDALAAPTNRSFYVAASGGSGFTTVHANAYFDHGVAAFTGGANANLFDTIETSVRVNSTTQFVTLQSPMPFTVAVGDTVTVIVGCDKQGATCRDKFSLTRYQTEFRGFEDVPGFDRTIRHPRGV